MISKKTSIAISALVIAASSAQASFVSNEIPLTTIPAEMINSPVASLLAPLGETKGALPPVRAEQVAWSPICEVILYQGAMNGVSGGSWDLYGCN